MLCYGPVLKNLFDGNRARWVRIAQVWGRGRSIRASRPGQTVRCPRTAAPKHAFAVDSFT